MGPKKAVYFEWHPRTEFRLIGDNKRQIIEAVKDYYDIFQLKRYIPSEEEISKINKFRVRFFDGDSDLFNMVEGIKSHDIKIALAPGATFVVPDYYFDYVRETCEGNNLPMFGDLFSFAFNEACPSLVFLPEGVVDGLRGYDWSKHEEQIKKWFAETEGGVNRIMIRRSLDNLVREDLNRN